MTEPGEGNAFVSHEQIDSHISDLRAAIERVSTRYHDDATATLFMQTLLSQVTTVKLHFALMCTESQSRFFLSFRDFDELMQPYLRLNKEIRRSVTKEPKSLYETTPINGVYELISFHFAEEVEV
jgi:hypothetical protein